MKKMLKISSLFLLAGALMFVLSACSLTGDNDTKKSSNSDTSSISIDDEDCETYDEDVFGEDLANIPRYKNSIRTYYAKDEYETDVTYETEDSEEKIRDYYTDLLEGDGWEQTGVATDYIDFEKGDEENPEILTVYFTPDEECEVLEYELVYSPPLSEEELAELEEEDEDFVLE